MKEMAVESRNLIIRSELSFSELNSPQKKSSNSGTRKRDNDSHHLLFLHGLEDGADLYYVVKSKIFLSGQRQGTGIKCSHCFEVVSPSQFEAHAGFGTRRQPAKDFSSNTFDDRTVIICEQCEKEYHIGCLRESCICDMKELPLDKWFCCQDCDNIHVALQQRVMKGASMIPFYVDPDITSKGSSEITESDMQWQILHGKESSRLELLSQAVAIFQEHQRRT